MGTDGRNRALSACVDAGGPGGRMYALVVACRYIHDNDEQRDGSPEDQARRRIHID